jgi:hypothetical protein
MIGKVDGDRLIRGANGDRGGPGNGEVDELSAGPVRANGARADVGAAGYAELADRGGFEAGVGEEPAWIVAGFGVAGMDLDECAGGVVYGAVGKVRSGADKATSVVCRTSAC